MCISNAFNVPLTCTFPFSTTRISLPSDSFSKSMLSQLQMFMRNIFNHMNNHKQKHVEFSNKLLIVSDSNKIKKICNSMDHNKQCIFISNTVITHTGYQSAVSMDTMIDFFMLSNSLKNYCFTRYNWGSGFSEWISYLRNIPYRKKVYI